MLTVGLNDILFLRVLFHRYCLTTTGVLAQQDQYPPLGLR
jgi:hypothetical protein